MTHIDINCDLGEGIGNEALLMPYLSSCNIACGGHAGDELTMNMVSDLAKKHHVKIGAHPSFPDKENFGRKDMSISPKDLKENLIQQINALKDILDKKNLTMHHIKPHGALYNMTVSDKAIANIVIDVIKNFDAKLVLYAPYKSVISEIATQKGIKVMFEGFADRNYNNDLTLISRTQNDALIQNQEAMFEHVFRMISDGKVKTISGVEVPLKIDTLCVHGDHENVVNNLKYLTKKLKHKNIEIL